MNNTLNETFSFGNEANNLEYSGIAGLGESNYENEDLFNTEVSDGTLQNDDYVNSIDESQSVPSNDILNQYEIYANQVNGVYNQEFNQNEMTYSDMQSGKNFEDSTNSMDEQNNQFDQTLTQEIEPINFVTDEETDEQQKSFQPFINLEEQNNSDFSTNLKEDVETIENKNYDYNVGSEQENGILSKNKEKDSYSSNIDNSYLDISSNFENTEFNNDYSLPVVEPTVEYTDDDSDDSTSGQTNIFTDTPISELEKLTHYEEEKIQTTDIKALFDRVGINVKEASDIFKKNTEMKEKIDSRFEELKKLQSEVEKNKKSQYDEINAYKEEVLGKLTEKKEEIERRLNKLKDFQSSLEKERQEFEQYRKKEKEEIDRVQKEVQEAYESRREELNHIEDVLRKQKDALDEERSQLSLDRIQYESDKNELANNLLKFNEIVGSFTNGMDKINKEQA